MWSEQQAWECKLCKTANSNEKFTCTVCGVPRTRDEDVSSNSAVVSVQAAQYPQQHNAQQSIITSSRRGTSGTGSQSLRKSKSKSVGNTSKAVRKSKSMGGENAIQDNSKGQNLISSAGVQDALVDDSANRSDYNPPSLSPRNRNGLGTQSNKQQSSTFQRHGRSDSQMSDKYDIMPNNQFSESNPNKGSNPLPIKAKDNENYTGQIVLNVNDKYDVDETLEDKKSFSPESEFRRSYFKAKRSTRNSSRRRSSTGEWSSASNEATITMPEEVVEKDPHTSRRGKSFNYSYEDEDDSVTFRSDDTYSSSSTYSSFGMSKSFEQNETAIEAVRLERLARLLSPTWFGKYEFSPAYAQRLVNFKYAQQKRREVYGYESPWGIMGLYEHLSNIRNDIRWAEEVERRKEYGLPHLSWVDFDNHLDSVWNTPIFTYVLMFVCTGLLIVSIWLNGWKFESLSSNPTVGPSADVLLALGAKDSNLIVNYGEFYRLVTPMFLHAGIVHYFINMMALNAVGRAVEQSHGSLAAFFMFVLPAVAGTTISAIMLPQYISVGASGGIFGLMGACIADICLHWSLLFSNIVNGPGGVCRHFFVVVILFLDIAMNCLIGLTPFVDNWTHMGGMVFGTLCAFMTMNRVRFSPSTYRKRRCCDACLPFLAALLTFGSLLASGIVLFTGDGYTAPCTVCQKVSCVEFPPWANSTSKWWYCDNCGMASADAHIDDDTGYYDYLNMLCPNGKTITFDLDEMTNDTVAIQQSLPSYCRLNCDDSTYVY